MVVVADSSKMGRRGFAKIADVAVASDIVTDDAADPAAVASIREAGVAVTTV